MPEIPARCPVCAVLNGVEEYPSDTPVYACHECGFWGFDPTNLEYSPNEDDGYRESGQVPRRSTD
jgi:hypothetical protein